MQYIYLLGEIEAPLARAVCIALTQITDPAMLFITSLGGDADQALAIVSAMRLAPFTVHTYCAGGVCSAAVDVLAAGVTRGMHPQAMGMTHGSSGSGDKQYKDLMAAREKAFYGDRPEILANWTLLFGRKHRYWSPAEMQEFGFIDYVSEMPIPGLLPKPT